MLKFNILIFLMFSSAIAIASSNSCETMLHNLANTQQLYVFCTTAHAVPVKICNGCGQQYLNMKNEYTQLMNDINCSKQYSESDRINVVGTTQSVLTGLWNRANCDDCIKGNHSDEYDTIWAKWAECLENNKKNNLECIACLPQYLELNDFYRELEKKNIGKVCFDLQDSMNRSRVLWSKELKCCQREPRLAAFISSVGVVTAIIVLFYAGVVFLTLRREANHGTLNDTAPELDAPSTSSLITAAILSTTSADETSSISAREEKINSILATAEDSSDSDDPLPTFKSKLS
ncbi:osteopetrosis-associated transmembrane protein 1 [Scaptodrosophila lebanonensis]|uniref:Osteopetrosis-associated transmembrane protein 1 n=1 Tax=Drosophila lebanonensis TaxID=7225 RepID=A0A6J2UEZ8_DROLE|nr:osteopetrosis-associated transmembrane protein 1 [Scaptodrosophila lebanonensis]